MRHADRHDPGLRAGWTLPQIIAAVVAAALLIVLIGYCFGVGTSLDTSINPKAFVLTPEIQTVSYGGTLTITVTLEFDQPYSRERDAAFEVDLYEAEPPGFPDVLLDSTVVVIVPRGQTEGTVDVELDCTVTGALLGESGSQLQGFFDYLVYGRLKAIPDGVVATESDNVEVECRQERQ